MAATMTPADPSPNVNPDAKITAAATITSSMRAQARSIKPAGSNIPNDCKKEEP
ncbi:hypothetical protein [Bacillus sp. RHFS10]|uniref:hypothetical protein n=1 Tax=Bacillus sp. RHFS10 TaxID=2804501 RepID=UPI001F5DBD5B|nr:hypothetical protein [Bacillus sp. RHFS10]